MTRESINERRLRLWKARQEAKGYDVSNVRTLQEAERYFDNPIKKEVKEVDPSKETKEIVDNINNNGGGMIKLLEELSYKELQDVAKSLGLKTIGVKKDDLIAKIKETKEMSSQNNTEGIQEPPQAPVVPQVTFTDEDVTGSTEVTEEVVQAVANAIVDEAQENGKTIETVVNEIVVEGTEQTTTEEETIVDIDIPDEPPLEEAQNIVVPTE